MRLRIFQISASKSQSLPWGSKLTEVFPIDNQPTAHSRNNKWMWQYECGSVAGATSALTEMSACWSEQSRVQHSPAAPNWICLAPSFLPSDRRISSVEASLDYLREILPVGAKLVEDHPTIGNRHDYGRTNAHGKPLDPHVAGICHAFPHHSIPELAALLDVYLPTRLLLQVSDVIRRDNIGTGNANEDDWEAVLENSDCIYHEGELSNEAAEIYRRLWEVQAAGNSRETYAICHTTDNVHQLREVFRQTFPNAN